MRFGVSGGRRAFPHLLFVGHLLFRAENTFIGNSSYLHLWFFIGLKFWAEEYKFPHRTPSRKRYV